MSGTLNDFDDRDFLAADYVMGTLEGAEWRAAARRLRRDPAFRAEVEDWQQRLGPLALAPTPVSPPAGLWNEIEEALALAPASAAGPVAAAAPERSQGLVSRVWRWLAIGSSGLAVASLLLIAVIALPLAPQEEPSASAGQDMAAAIAGEDGLALFTVVLDADGHSATLVPVRMETGAGQVPELWLIPDGGTPLSLGVVNASQPLRIQISEEMMDLRQGGTLAISLEPEGGSPTGQPTGPVVGHGALHSI